MSLSEIRSQADFLQGSSDLTVHRTFKGSIGLLPANFIPNASLSEPGEDGSPLGWSLEWGIEKVVGYHVNVSRPGSPKLASVTRQTTAFVPPEENAWTMEEPWVAGVKGVSDSSIKPPYPDLEAVPNNNRGFEGGQYGWAWLLFSAFGPTTPTGVRFFSLLNGEMPKFPVPDAVRAPGVTHWGICMTKKDKGASTLALLRKIPVDQIRSEEVTVKGPWLSRGKPPKTNQSGVGTPSPVHENRDYKLASSGYDMPAGTWRAAIQIEKDGGLSVLSRWGEAIKVKPDRIRVKVAGPAPANAEFVDSAYVADASGGGSGVPPIRGGGDPVDPRSVRPSGKHPDNEYMGEEIDFEESRLVSLINAEREKRDLPVLVLNRALNRAAENGTDPDVEDIEGYEGRVRRVSEWEDTAEEALRAFVREPGSAPLYEAYFEAVGVARVLSGGDDGDWHWRLILGDDPEFDDSEAVVCETVVVEHVEEDGTVYASEVDGVSFDDVRNSWSSVSNGNMRYSYNGSFNDAVSTAAQRTDRLGAVNVTSGGGQVAITDGSLPAGVMGRSYSDGRMVLDSSTFSSATRNARFACAIHEFWHHLGLDHPSSGIRSVLHTPIIVNGSSNAESPTSYDESEYRSLYGSGSGGGGSRDSDPPGGHGNEVRKPDEKEETEEPEFHFEWRELPYKKNTSMRVDRPKKLRGRRGRGLRYTYWLRHESLSGTVTTYRVVKPGSRKGAGAYFHKNRLEVCCEVPDDSGTVETGKRKAPLYALLQEEVPTEDTTVLEPPDSTSLPDEPSRGGQQVPTAGRYLCTVSGVLEDGSLTKQSEPGRDSAGNPYLNITNAQMPKVNLPATINRLKNAEFSRLNAAGTPEDWTPVNAGVAQSGYFDATGGILTLGAASSTNLAPRFDSAVIPYDPATTPVLTIAGTVGANRVTTGTIRITLRQLGETGGIIGSELTAADLAIAAELPFTAQFGEKGTPLDPNTVSFRLILKLNGATVNAEGYFKNLRVLGLPCDVRYVEEAEEGTTFDAAPDTPVSGSSFIHYGPAPEAESPTVQESDPPLLVAGFDSGAVPTGLTRFGNAGTNNVFTDAAIHETHGYRVADLTKTASQVGGVEGTIPGLTFTRSAHRTLYVFDTLPTTGWADFHLVTTPNDGTVAFLRVGSGGGLQVVVAPNNSNARFFPLGVSVRAGEILDAEILFTPGKNGILAVGIGINGQRRIVFSRNFDFSGRSANHIKAGVFRNAGASTRYNLRLDQVVVTEGGDVLDREKPKAPPGYVAPPLDRPVKTASPRTFDTKERKLGQLYALATPGAAPPEDPAVVPLLDDPVPVRPGLSYTFGAFMRWCNFSGIESPGLRVWLEAEDNSKEAFVAANIPMAGERGWHGVPEEDDFRVFDVPEGYDLARFELVLHDGVYCLQEFLFSMGTLSDFASRDTQRNGGMATTGQGEWIFDLMPDGYGLGLTPGVFVSEFGVKTQEALVGDAEPAGTLTTEFTTSADQVDWLPYSSVEDTPFRYLKMALAFTGDGESGPTGIPFARTWSPFGVLLRPDGTHFPGVAYVGNLLSSSSYPDVEVRNVGGRLALIPTSGTVERMEDQKIPIGVCTEEARREVQYLSSVGPLLMEIPTLGGTVAGQSLLVVFGERLKLEPRPVPPRIANGRRVFFAGGEADYAEVLEASPQQAPMKAIDFNASPVLSVEAGGASL